MEARLWAEVEAAEAAAGGGEEDLLLRDFRASLAVAPGVVSHAPLAFRHLRALLGAGERRGAEAVRRREAAFLLRALPGYYLGVSQNPTTLLPKFLALYSVKGRTWLLVVGGRVPPGGQTFLLKGATPKARTSKTLNDADFSERHPRGLGLEAEVYDSLLRTLERDCRLLRSFGATGYGLLLGVHRPQKGGSAAADPPGGGFPARSASGDRLLLFLGVVDVLREYRLRDRLRRALLLDASAAPDAYAGRFLSFVATRVFRRLGADAGAEADTSGDAGGGADSSTDSDRDS